MDENVERAVQWGLSKSDGHPRVLAAEVRELQPLRAEVAQLRVRLFASLGWDGRQDPSPSWDTLLAAARDRTDERDALAAEVRALRNEDASSDVVRITREQLHRLETERDNWRDIAQSLRARDTAAQRVIEAIVRPGPAPEYHRRQILRLAEGWRPLAQALAALCRVYDQQAPRGWS